MIQFVKVQVLSRDCIEPPRHAYASFRAGDRAAKKYALKSLRRLVGREGRVVGVTFTTPVTFPGEENQT